MVKVFKNILKKEEADYLEDRFTFNNFPWFITRGIVNENIDKDYQFNHIFYTNFRINSDFFNLLEPILNVLKPTSLIRIKANLVPKESKITKHKMHTDLPDSTNYKTAVYYVNTNNGCTLFKNNKKIISEKNKLVVFNGDVEHGSTTCTNKDYRVVLNFNYFE
jgi:hypothetical protein